MGQGQLYEFQQGQVLYAALGSQQCYRLGEGWLESCLAQKNLEVLVDRQLV